MTVKRFLWVADKKLESVLPLVIILFILVILRIPSLFEPVWYLDESIYLTIGHALNQGAVLYKDIVDHKTPMIYYLARVGGQTQFALLLISWMSAATVALYFILKKTITSKKVVFLTTLLFAIISASPLLEGLTPNGELFVMGFVLWGLWALTKSRIWHTALGQELNQVQPEQSFKQELLRYISEYKRSVWLIFISGIFFSLAVLTKVPAVFDLMSVALLIYVGFWSLRRPSSITIRVATYFHWLLPELLVFSLGLILPILLTIIYFAFKSALPEYINYGLLYNFHYAGTWVPATFPGASIILSLPAKLLLTILGVIVLTLLRKHCSTLMFWSGSWTLFALVGATLSNRPYPHYFIQVLLPTTFVTAAFLTSLQLWWKRADILNLKPTFMKGNTLTASVLLVVTLATWGILGTWHYSALEYYIRFFKLITRTMTSNEYSADFSDQVLDNYSAAQVFKDNQMHSLYIWGTNPSLYVLTRTTPADSLIVLFHVQDMQHEQETIQAVTSASPDVIALMHDAEDPPLAFRNFLHNQYVPWQKYDTFSLWRLRSAQ